MDERCPWVDRAISATDSLDAEVADHLALCPHCAAERQAHEALVGAFREVARPALSPHFHRRLMARVENERRRNRITRRRVVVMRVYWSAATVVCAAVLANLSFTPLTSVQQGAMLAAVAALLLPIATLLFVIRIDPFELILQTLAGVSEKRPSES